MRVLFISTMAGAAWGGSEELWVKTAAHAMEQGHQISISVYDWGALHPKVQQLKEKGAQVTVRKRIYFGSSVMNRGKGLLVKKIFAEREIIQLKSFKPEAIVISQGTIYECMSPGFLHLQNATKAKILIITQANSEYETIPTAFYNAGRRLFEKAHHLFFVSKRNLLVAERQLAMAFNNASVISNPANLSEHEIVKWPEGECIQFAFVGRLNSTVKGLGVLLQILSDSKWRSRNWKLNLFGKGEDESYLKDLVKLYALEEKVFFHGFVSKISLVWEQNHLLLMPSTLEGTPLSLIEAMLCGRTAVVSDVGGNAELIDDDLNGFVAEAPSVHSFGKAMERMWNRKSELSDLGVSAFGSLKNKIDLNAHQVILKSVEEDENGKSACK